MFAVNFVLIVSCVKNKTMRLFLFLNKDNFAQGKGL